MLSAILRVPISKTVSYVEHVKSIYVYDYSRLAKTTEIRQLHTVTAVHLMSQAHPESRGWDRGFTRPSCQADWYKRLRLLQRFLLCCFKQVIICLICKQLLITLTLRDEYFVCMWSPKHKRAEEFPSFCHYSGIKFHYGFYVIMGHISCLCIFGKYSISGFDFSSGLCLWPTDVYYAPTPTLTWCAVCTHTAGVSLFAQIGMPHMTSLSPNHPLKGKGNLISKYLLKGKFNNTTIF